MVFIITVREGSRVKVFTAEQVKQGTCVAMAEASARRKVSIKFRVAVDAKPVGDWGKLFDDNVKVQGWADWSAVARVAADFSARAVSMARRRMVP